MPRQHTTKPRDLFNRDHEWADLVEFATSPGPGLRLGIVRGRRRQGKSFILRRLARALGGFYYQALEEERAQALESLGTALGRHFGVPGGRLRFDSWSDAITALADALSEQKPSAHAPALAIIDEFPYLLAHAPELQSILQREIDSRRSSTAPAVRLILCGSALSVMAQLLSGTQALRGRASLDLVIQPFSYREAAQYWAIPDEQVAFYSYSIFGGTPGYRDLVDASPPRELSGFGRWLAKGPLNPSSALFREDDYMLTTESVLTDRALYHSVMSVIAGGKTTQGQIAAALGREQRAVQYPLSALEESGFVVRDEDLLRRRRPSYRLADPILRFHHAVTRPAIADFEDRHTAEAWSEAQQRFRSQVLGPQFEQMARDFTRHHASEETLGGSPSLVGRAVANDPSARLGHEIDVVALDARPQRKRPKLLAIGEAKVSFDRRSTSHLDRLERIRELLGKRDDIDTSAARLILFSASGFGAPMYRLAAARNDVELADLDRLYRGS